MSWQFETLWTVWGGDLHMLICGTTSRGTAADGNFTAAEMHLYLCPRETNHPSTLPGTST